ncbi:MAG: hypothetical protein U5R31_06430 [Acidimicrobiia bacterium]|nr:hypothetical protein [Acidimicrobiia bacterium]
MRVVRVARARLEGWHDERDLFHAAAAELAGPTDPASDPAILLGPVVLYLPGSLTPSATGLVRALAASVPAEIVAGRTGFSDADEPALETAAALGASVAGPAPATSAARSAGASGVGAGSTPDGRSDVGGAVAGSAGAPPVGTPSADVRTRVVSVPDVDEEVRMALRELLAAGRRRCPSRPHGHPVPLPTALPPRAPRAARRGRRPLQRPRHPVTRRDGRGSDPARAPRATRPRLPP